MKSKNKAVLLNMIANILSFSVNLVISFFLTPYITKNVGTEAYGLVGLANSFTNYITVVTAALNSMASRFIIIELHKRNNKKANVYFNSVLMANTLIAIILMIPAIWLILNIEILNISKSLLFDAKITFVLVFISFVMGLIGAFFGIVLYAKNMLWKGSFRSLESNVLRVFVILLLFSVFSGKIYFVAFSTLLSSVYCIGFNVYYTKKYIPELKIKKTYFSFNAIKTLVMSGLWNSITRLSQILLDGLDLLLSNIFINGIMTGNVSIAKTIPSLYTTVVAMLSDSFYPQFLELYSKNKKKELLKSIKQSINILSSISGICLSMLLVYSKDFYSLWLPNNDSNLLSTLTLLSVGTVLISGCVYSLYSVFSLVNKIKINSIALLITGILSSLTTYICLKYLDMGVYAIVGVSSFYGIIRNLFFTPVYAARCLKINLFTFYPVLFKNLVNIFVLILVEILLKECIIPNSWQLLILNGLISILIGMFTTYIIILDKEQKKYILMKIFKGEKYNVK